MRTNGPTLILPGLYAELTARFAAPAEPDPRVVQAINGTDDADERAELVELAEAQRQEANRRNRVELARRQRTGEPFRLPRWQVINREVRDTGLPVADRAYSEYEVGPDDVIRPVAKFYGVDRQEWTGDGWTHVPSITRPPTLPEDDAMPLSVTQH
ncbi:hypothetical protein [Mycobacteroides salmoniphilum]|uniref:Uncharacterized protein n=1 Tax=Mycobacteroides salmoniphilum TaxID=404941 RepID=A0A4R8SHL7_9MYCO|nr:hypothetical protein [Mycobacteroides salmoniphilum]TDZ96339.1 hypothetical protein CCUG60885_02483 [Mycobacteroides salmoniphilum]TEA05434.1 hypothetical protein CCUG60883_02740 [Mycobacteroides salmoniphilum]